MLPRLAHCTLVCTTLVWTLLPAVAAAEPTVVEHSVIASPTATLYWRAPSGCPTESDFRRRIEEYLGPNALSEVQLLAHAVVVASSSGFHVTLRLEQAGQTRTRILDAASCAETLDASALVVALAIDPTVVSRLSDASSTSSPAASTQPIGVAAFSAQDCHCPEPTERVVTAPCPPSIVTAPAPTQALPPKPTSRRYFEFYQNSEVDFQRLPGLSLGLGLGVAMNYAELRLSVTAATSDGIERSQSAGGTFRLVEGRFHACWMASNPLSLGPCAGMSLGAITGKGFGVDLPQRATKLWSSASLGGLLRYTPGDFSEVGLYASAELPFTRPYFDLSQQTVYRPPSLGLIAGLMLGLRLK